MTNPPEFFEELVENSRDIVVVMARDGRVRYVNRAVRAIFGDVSEWEAVEDVFDLVHPEDRDRVAADFASSVSSPTPGTPITFRMLHQEGGWRYVEASGANLFDRASVGGFLVNLRDVTDRIEAEARHERAASRYRHALDRSPQPTAMHQDGIVVYTNPAAARLLGGVVDDIVARPVDDFIPESSADAIYRRTALALEGEDAGLAELEFRRLDGSILQVEVASVLIDWLGRPAVQVIARDLTERNRDREALETQALHDPLTGLPNRTLLTERLMAAAERHRHTGKRYAVVFTDLDKFKVLNDGLGHSAGDVVLREVADRLAGAARVQDTVARFGGDEFVLVLEQLEPDVDVRSIVQRFAETLRRPFSVGTNLVRIGMSGGIVVVDGDLGDRDVLSEADAALYRAKRIGRGQFVEFDQELREEVRSRYQREEELHAAFEGNELVAHFQREVDLRTGRTVGAEALCRWEHPTAGTLLPGSFLEVVEDIGAMDQLGDRVRGAALAEVAHIRQDPALAACWVSVNVSASELLSDGFGERVERDLERYGLPAQSLCIELTESSLATDPDAASRIVQDLRRRGVAFAVDAFGTGYASLSYLDRFSPDYVKIDRVFIDGMLTDDRRRALVRSAIEIAHTFGAVAVAEGVESEPQRKQLVELGCDLIQGYLVGRPQPHWQD